MSLVLYRKYRPQKFSEFIGQEHVVQTLKNAILREAISHAYLFSGPRGCGKTTMARILAKVLNCQKRKVDEFEPCDQCISCIEIKEGRAIDLIEIDAASHRGIDEVRELKEGIRFLPTKSKYKVFIIDEAHQLTKEAANALLKTLEEPPKHAIFILATTEFHKMIPTIRSRCQQFDFRKLTLTEIIKRLEWIAEKEKIKIEKPILKLIAASASGSLRDAESLLDQILTFSQNFNKPLGVKEIKEFLGLIDWQAMNDFSNLLFQKKTAESINFLNAIYEKGVDLQEFAKSFIEYLRRVLILKTIGTEALNLSLFADLNDKELEKLKNQLVLVKEVKIEKILKIFLEAENKIKYSPLPQLDLELAVIDSIEFIKISGPNK